MNASGATHYSPPTITSECDSSTAPYSENTFLLDSSKIVDPSKSVQKRLHNEHLSNKPKTTASKTPQLLRTMTHSQEFPQDDTLSPKLASLSCAALLKKSLPTSKALHTLRLKIQQQKLKRETPASGVLHRELLTRKVCRVKSKEARAAQGTGEVIRLSVRKHPVSCFSPNACHQRSALRAEHSTYISAWRNAQGLVKQVLKSPCTSVSSAERVNLEDQCKLLNKRASQEDENTGEKNTSLMKDQSLSKSKLYSSKCGTTFVRSSGSSCTVNALPLTNRNHYYSKTSLIHNIKTHHCGITNTARSLAPKGKENESQTKLGKQSRRDIEKVREYMHRQAMERRKTVMQMKKEAELENERKQKNVQEVVKKQMEVLHRAKKEQKQDHKYVTQIRGSSKMKNRAAYVPDTGEGRLLIPPRQNQSVLVAEQVDQGSCTPVAAGSPESAAEACRTQNVLAAQRHRVEALRKTIDAPDTRMDDETAWLRITGHKEALRQSRPAGQGICEAESRETLSDSVSVDKVADFRQMGVSIKKEIKDDKDEVDLGHCAAEIEFRPQIDQTEKGQEDQSDSSESTESTSKWSELSELYSQQLHGHLSLAQSQQFLREEELRARQYSALFRLREKALLERTQAELEWLGHCKRQGTAQDDVHDVAELRRKQEEVVHRFRQEQAEIHHWRNIYRLGRQQRRLLLHHQRDILNIKQSAIHYRQELQKQTLSKKYQNFRPENAAQTMQEDEDVVQSGIMPDAGDTDKIPREQGRQPLLPLVRLGLQVEARSGEWQQRFTGDLKEDRLLFLWLHAAKPLCDGIMPVMNRSGILSKAGLRRLLSSDEVWSFGRKRNQVELVPAEQDILQIAESNNPVSSPSHRYTRQSQSTLRLISPERLAKTEGNTPCQNDSVKTLKAGSKVNEQETQRKVQGFYEESCIHKSDESYTGERLPHPTEGPQKSPIISGFPKEDLLHDSKGSHLKSTEQQDVKNTHLVHGSPPPDTAALNVQNNQRMQSVLSLNNNHNICEQDAGDQWKSSFSYPRTDKTCTDLEFPQETNETITDNPLIENLILEAGSADIRKSEDSPSCDVSLSEIDEKSEAISFHSEALAWSEDEKDCLSEDKTEASTHSLFLAEKYTVVPDNSQYDPYLNNKHCEENNTLPHFERQMTVESILSEILSPVDEVLSYGSAELPPSVKGGFGSGLDSNSFQPPPPAFEIITWTSEEELPAPPDFVEDLSINSENLPPLPVDLSLRRRESQSLDSNSSREKEKNNDDANEDHGKTVPPALSVCEDEENDCSEYTNSIPEDIGNESSDPLSSFQIGDRVLVCNSRPGVLKYKGLTAFADGFWAGVALDTPNGNHNGTFRGVKYFSCEKSHGVLVRAEDISHIHREQGSDIDTGLDEDPFSDQDPPGAQRDKQEDSSSEGGQGRHTNTQCPPRVDSLPPENTSQNKPQKDKTDRQKDLTHTSEIPSPGISHELIRRNEENSHHVENFNHSVVKLTEELRNYVFQCAQDTRKRQRQKMKSVQENKSIATDKRKNEDSYFMPCLLEQWHQPQPKMPPKIKVLPHEASIVYRLVDVAVEILCGQANDDTLHLYETPSYLLDDGGRKLYRQVIFQLTSDVLHEVLGDLLRAKESPQKIDDKSVIAALQSSKISVTFLKAAVREEIQKILNLDRSEQQMTEMLQKLCKYWYAKRDRVDYILIQELHNEERTWLDYSADQHTVKMRLTEEIFNLLLDDTISALNH